MVLNVYEDGEYVDHLLHCEGACALWIFFFSRYFGLSWVIPSRVVDLLAW
jgi:hypothetical protein